MAAAASPVPAARLGFAAVFLDFVELRLAADFAAAFVAVFALDLWAALAMDALPPLPDFARFSSYDIGRAGGPTSRGGAGPGQC